MANILIVKDSDEQRRAAFIEKILPRMAPVEGLTQGSVQQGDLSVLWAASPRAPISHQRNAEGLSVIWGHAVDESGSVVSAGALDCGYDIRNPEKSLQYEGFFGALKATSEGLIVGSDLLGLFPLYYYYKDDVLLIGTSPALFYQHPKFERKVDYEGVMGMLITMHQFDGRTGIRGLKRLGSGSVLFLNRDRRLREVCLFKIPISEKNYGLSLRQNADIFYDVLVISLKRMLNLKQPFTFLCSGGIDTRILLGQMVRQQFPVDALTLGDRGDVEMACARKLCNVLKIKHRAGEVSLNKYADWFNMHVYWENGLNGMNNVWQWSFLPPLNSMAPSVVTGHIFGSLAGGPTALQRYPQEKASFEGTYKVVNSWGLGRETIISTLNIPDAEELYTVVKERMHKEYMSYADRDFQRTWCFELYNRERFHVGGMLWSISFGSWPVLTGISRELLREVAGMPAAAFANRTLQHEILKMHFPDLAKLPIDRNCYDDTPLNPKLTWMISKYMRDRFNEVTHLLHLNTHKHKRNLFYYRLYDFNGPGWRSIRRQVERQLEELPEIFRREGFLDCVPDASADVSFGDGIVNASGLKTLLGLHQWARKFNVE